MFPWHVTAAFGNVSSGLKESSADRIGKMTPNYRVEDHVERLQLQPPADETALLELINKKMNTRLDFAHPLWKVTLVDNYPEGSVFIIRVHHCIADGISLMQVLSQMTRSSPDEPADQAVADNLNRDEDQPAIPLTALQAAEHGKDSATVSTSKPGGGNSKAVRGNILTKTDFYRDHCSNSPDCFSTAGSTDHPQRAAGGNQKGSLVRAARPA